MRLLTSLCAVAAYAAVTSAEHQQIVDEENESTPLIQPSKDRAAANAHRIFNEVHSAGRQWGSSLNHNGLGFVPGVIPRGSVFYHGTQHEEVPEGKEWLAFETEHAEAFGQSRRKRDMHRRPRKGKGKDPDEDDGRDASDSDEEGGDQMRLELRSEQQLFVPNETMDDEAMANDGNDDDEDEEKWVRGYLQVYQANRDLNVLYIDGMSAGKTNMGTVDSQDLVLRNLTYKDGPSIVIDDWDRADEICALAAEWGLDGVVRMEIGFEVIHCDFHSGLDMLWMTRAAIPEEQMSRFMEYGLVQLVRAVGERYDGLGDRLRLDFSSMVSGLFFPMNVTNLDPRRPDLVRLGSAEKKHLVAMREHLRGVVSRPRSFTVNWQFLADLIVGRFSERLALMTSAVISDKAFISEIQAVTGTYYDTPRSSKDVEPYSLGEDRNRTAEAMDLCTAQILNTAVAFREEWSLEDSLLHTAFETVTRDICTAFYAARQLLLDAASPAEDESGYSYPSSLYALSESDRSSQPMQQAIAQGQVILSDLVERLDWTGWKKPRRCGVDDTLFVAMWPMGNQRDHFEPGCRTVEQMNDTRSDYWPWSPLA